VITYRRNGKYDGPRGNMDYVEHKQLFDSIRVAQPINNGHHMRLSSALAIKARLPAISAAWSPGMS
jgi:hypothetical protein